MRRGGANPMNNTREPPRLTLTIDSWVLARKLAYNGITTTALKRCATILWAAAKSMSVGAKSSVITGECCFNAS